MWLFLAVPWVCLQIVIVVFPDHTHLLFFSDPLYAHIIQHFITIELCVMCIDLCVMLILVWFDVLRLVINYGHVEMVS